METVGGADDRDRMRAADMVRSVAFDSSSSATEQTEDKEICIRQVVNEAGRAKESPGLDIKVGKVAKQLLLQAEPNAVIKQKSVYCNGQVISANMWLSSQRHYLQRAIASISIP